MKNEAKWRKKNPTNIMEMWIKWAKETKNKTSIFAKMKELLAWHSWAGDLLLLVSFFLFQNPDDMGKKKKPKVIGVCHYAGAQRDCSFLVPRIFLTLFVLIKGFIYVLFKYWKK